MYLKSLFLADSPGLPVVLLQNRLHRLELRKVLTHVRVQDHLDEEVAQVAEVNTTFFTEF